MSSPFQDRTPNIDGNQQLREPQREAYQHLADFAQEITAEETPVPKVILGPQGPAGPQGAQGIQGVTTRDVVS